MTNHCFYCGHSLDTCSESSAYYMKESLGLYKLFLGLLFSLGMSVISVTRSLVALLYGLMCAGRLLEASKIVYIIVFQYYVSFSSLVTVIFKPFFF